MKEVYEEIQESISDLIIYNHEIENIFEIANYLQKMLFNEGFQDMSRAEIDEYLFSENDIVDQLEVSDLILEEIREIQHAIINFWS